MANKKGMEFLSYQMDQNTKDIEKVENIMDKECRL